MKRKFKVIVDGKSYTVEVEELESEVELIPEESPKNSQRLTKTYKRDEPSTKVIDNGLVKAPLPGVISELKIVEGDQVRGGSILLVLEAMKMENEIYAPFSGNVKKIYVKVRQKVGRGDKLVLIS